MLMLFTLNIVFKCVFYLSDFSISNIIHFQLNNRKERHKEKKYNT